MDAEIDRNPVRRRDAITSSWMAAIGIYKSMSACSRERSMVGDRHRSVRC
jgi:hypothetical protein